MNKVVIGLLLFTIVGCAPMVRLNTPSGRPEITINHVDRKTVTDRIVEIGVEAGYELKATTEYTLVFGKPRSDFTSSMMFGSRYDINTEERITFTIIARDSSVKVTATCAMIGNPGSAFERKTDITTGKTAANL